jgi:glyoxylase-like metal-dependent hydrolase (beta-lactamase superfamily II)
MPFRLARPRRPDARLLSSLVDAGLPAARRQVRLMPLLQARQQAPMPVVAEGVWSPRTANMGMVSFVVEHPSARIIVDPALCADVHDVVLPGMPQAFRSLVAPDKPVVGLAESLAGVGLGPDDIDQVVPTHLHWDHVSGLLELPASLSVLVRDVERDFGCASPTPLGVVTKPLLGRTFTTLDFDGPPVLTFAASHDLFGDGAVVLVDLGGHTPGSIGVLLALADDRRVLLAGDAVWNRMQVSRIREKAPLPGRLVDADRRETWRTVHRLHALPDSVVVVPSHDRDAVAALGNGSR